MRAVIWFLLTLAGGYGALVLFLYVAQRGLMYHPGTGPLPAPAETQLPEAQILRLRTADGLDLVSWYVPPKDDRKVVVYFQGNAGTLAERDFKARRLVDAGYGVVLLGYRGYGGNPGQPSEQGLYLDAQAVGAFLGREGIPPSRRVAYGESLGSGVAVQAAVEAAKAGEPLAGVILEAPFTTMGRAAQDHYPYVPAVWLVRDKYDSLDKIAGIAAPLLVMHGDADRVVHERHGRRVFEAAKEPKRGFWVPGGGHSDLEDFGAGNAVLDFLKSL